MKRRTFLLGAGAVGVAAAGSTAGVLASRQGGHLVPGVPRARRIVGDETLPRATEVVVIGGGFVGANAALTLAERGVPVALCEKGVVAGEASGRSMGYMNGQFSDPVKTPMITRSKRLWAGMNERLGAESGFRPTGIVLAIPEEKIPDANGWIKSQSDFPAFDYRVVTGSELERLLPDNRARPRAAIFSPSDGSVDPVLAVPAMAEAARGRGARILQNCAVREVELSGGRVSGVVTEKGRIACRSVIVAGGSWSPLLLSGMDIDLPQIDAYLSQYALSAVPGPTMPLAAEGYGIRRQVDGGYTLGFYKVILPIEPAVFKYAGMLRPSADAYGSMANLGLSFGDFWTELTQDPRSIPSPFEKRRIMTPEVRTAPLDKALTALRAAYPVFEASRVTDKWAGVLSTTPDNMPYISAVSERPGLLVGSGLVAGLSWGPAAGEALADLATGRSPQFDLRGYRANRFRDGSPLTFRP